MRLLRGLGLSCALALLGPVPAHALTLDFGLNFEFSGAAEPASPTTPWVTVSIDDSVPGADTVRITITNVNLSVGEFTSRVYLNFDPLLDPTQLSVSDVDTSAISGLGNLTFNTGVDSFKADGDGFFDIFFDLPPPPGNAKFGLGETLIVDLTYALGPISAASFDFTSAPGGGTGTYGAAAHVQGIANPSFPGFDSGWIGEGLPPVPEPGTPLLMLAAAALVAGLRRRP